MGREEREPDPVQDWRADMSGEMLSNLLHQVADGLSQGAQDVLLGLSGNQDHSEEGPALHNSRDGTLTRGARHQLALRAYCAAGSVNQALLQKKAQR